MTKPTDPAVVSVKKRKDDKIPQLELAAKALLAGVISRAEYDKTVKKLKPVSQYQSIPRPATDEEALGALHENKRQHWRGASEFPEGHPVGLRLDIPAYSDHGVWVNSIHDESGAKTPVKYGPVSAVRNAEFDPGPSKAQRVATGETNKSPFAKIKGEWQPMTDEEAVTHMQQHLSHPDYVQVGYDPRRRDYFYHRGDTRKPITHAEHVVQIGPLVLAKNPVYGKRKDFGLKDGGVAHMDKGGLSKQERRANRKNFMEPSKDKRRFYHGSKEPNIVEFKTRKQISEENYPDDPSNDYRDERNAVFLSPDPKFTRHFSVEGYTDTGKAPTTYPVHVQVRNPFDFDKPKHRENLWKTYHDIYYNPESDLYVHGPHDTDSEKTIAEMRMKKRIYDSHKDENNWPLFENPNVQEAIQDMGHDSFYIKERGTKNLGVYDPRRIKSAIGNRGTYDINNSDINKKRGGRVTHAHHLEIEERPL